MPVGAIKLCSLLPFSEPFRNRPSWNQAA
jgi:hypothetical protein